MKATIGFLKDVGARLLLGVVILATAQMTLNAVYMAWEVGLWLVLCLAVIVGVLLWDVVVCAAKRFSNDYNKYP